MRARVAAWRRQAGLNRWAGLLASEDVLWLVGIVALAVLLRAVWVSYAVVDPLDGRFDDSVFYHNMGAMLARGEGYNNPWSGLPTAAWPPGYPFFLAGLYSLFEPNLLAAKLANVFLGAATCALLYLLGLHLFDRWSARLGAALLAVFPGQVVFASLIWAETLFTFVFLLGLLCILFAARRPSTFGRGWPLMAGLLFGVAALIRGQGLLLLLIALLFWGLTSGRWLRALRWTAAAAVVAVALLIPWGVRNYLAMDSVVLISTSTGGNFWMGHHEGATGRGILTDAEIPGHEHGPLDGPGGEVDINEAGLREGLKFMVTHPLDELRLAGLKIRWLYGHDVVGLNLNEDFGFRAFMNDTLRAVLRPLSNVFFAAVLAAAGFSLLHWLREKVTGPLLPVLTIAVWTMGHVAFFGEPRFHFPIMPAFCLLAGWAVVSTLAAMRAFALQRAPSGTHSQG
ncbi:MAG: glycosyltransferase family 39 protein [Dehalococcoidia bacterium]